MKKRSLVFVISLCLLVLSAYAQNMNGTILSVAGKVEKKIENGWQPVNAGEILKEGDLVSTGFKSSATIKIDNSVIEITALTRLTLTQLLEQDEKRSTSVYLDAGKINANIKSSDNKRVNFTVNTPVVTASVRGTAGSVTALGGVTSTQNVWSTSVVLSDGTVSEKVIPVSQGMSTNISVTTANVASPVIITMQNDVAPSILMDSLSDIASSSNDNSFISDSVSSSIAIETGSPNAKATCNVNVDVSFSH